MSLNTHDLIVDFGKHKGERWTRLPISYLKWLVNEATGERAELAASELARRGSVVSGDLEVSAHALDRASLFCRHLWHQQKTHGEGIHAWLHRVATDSMKEGVPDVVKHGIKFSFHWGERYPVLKTVRPARGRPIEADPDPFAEDGKEVAFDYRFPYTPGPWAISEDSEGYVIEDPLGRSGDDRKLAFVYLEKECPATGEINTAENKANMRLIAAAPEIYEALYLWMFWHYNSGHIEETYDDVVRIGQLALDAAVGPLEVNP